MTETNRYKGLSGKEAAESRARFGSNVLTPPKRKPWWREFLEKFSDPLIIILLVAGALSVGISLYEYFGLGQDWKVFFEPIGIFVAILLATGLAFLFESKANRAFRILNRVNDDEPVEVMRSGNVTTVPRRDIVVGDIVMLTTGAEIPADGRLLDAVTLAVDESTLTGEPLAAKTTDPAHFDKEATYPSDTVLRGTKVMEGHGVMRVERVGDATETGKVFTEAQIDDSVKTPLNEQLERLGGWITKASYVIAGLIVVGQFVYFLVSGQLQSWSMLNLLAHALKTLMVAVTLIVVAVPEGLPMAVTLSLAYSMSRMLKTNNLVRKMHACETMGATTVICTDKTGTLTQNRMQVHSADFYASVAETPYIYEGMAANSTATLDLSGDKPVPVGNPTEGALLLWLSEQGKDYARLRADARRLEELPFTTERKYMATVVRSASGKRVLYVKGAPEIVFDMCADTYGLSRQDIDARLREYQNMAMRTLGFAYAELADGQEPIKEGKVEADNLVFLGITAISDPVRDDVPEAVREVRGAGIQIKVVTGDTPATAKEISRRIGLWDDAADGDRNITTGAEIAAMSDAVLRERAEDLKIIARARPMDKKRLVEALQADGEVVAVTGDGTNDAPALKTAHVGLSMGDGTSVAKEASDITIIDNSFSSIGRAVMWGRSLYKNIQRFLLFQLTVNVAACLLVLVGSFMGTDSPLTVTQMLWVNLIMDTFGAMALASLPPSEKVMLDRPRPREASILTRPMGVELTAVGVVFFAITIFFYWLFNHSDVTSIPQLFTSGFWRTAGAPSEMTAYEATLLFSIFVWTHFWYMFDARAFETGESIFRLPMSRGFWTIVAIIVAGQLLITEVGFDFFNCRPFLYTFSTAPQLHNSISFNASGALDLLIIITSSSLVLWLRELSLLFRKSPQTSDK